jgi:AbrB family looped-hinge helix DNA binding protein
MTYSSTIDTRGRTIMPREVRQQLGLSAGDRVEFVVEGDEVVLQRARPATDVSEKYKGVRGKSPGGRKRINE